jgi:hypothetical protein
MAVIRVAVQRLGVQCVFHKNGTVISLTDGQQFH